jgi:antitoxin FitA
MINKGENDIIYSNSLISKMRHHMSTTSILIRDLPLETKAALQALAQKHQQSMAEEARQILNKAAARAAKQLSLQTGLEQQSVGHRIHARFKALGGIHLDIPPRDAIRALPDFAPTVSRKSR